MEKSKIVYLSGAITGCHNHKEIFERAEMFVSANMGHIAINPTRLDEISNEPLTYDQYMAICYRLIDISDAVFMVSGWRSSRGANAELTYAKTLGKEVIYQDYFHQFRKERTENVEG